MNYAEKLSNAIIASMKEKKALDIVLLDMRKVKDSVSDFFVICSGTSTPQLRAIVESIEDHVFKTLHEHPHSTEGKSSQQWILVDYISVTAHVFQQERRSVYQLEELWGKAKATWF